jgi:hypothetical protein
MGTDFSDLFMKWFFVIGFSGFWGLKSNHRLHGCKRKKQNPSFDGR